MNPTAVKVAAVVSVCCLVLSVGSLSVTAQVPDLQNYYTFDDSNDITHDSSGNDRNGLLDDTGVQWVDDSERGSGVLEFGGSTNGFMVAEVPDLTDEFSIAMWAYRDPSLCCAAPGANDGLFQVQAGSNLAPTLPPPSGTKAIGGWVQKTDAAVWGRVITADGNQNLDQFSYFMPDDEWVHLAYRGTGEEFEVVIDGESGAGPFTFYDGSTLLDVGSVYVGRQGDETWGGRLDDFRVYDRALTDGEIAAVMDGDVGGQVPNLQNLYTFDDSNNATQDSSGNGRDGKLDDTGVQWVDDNQRGGAMEFEGATNGFMVADVPELTGEFTVSMWAYRDSLLCCSGAGGNDGLFQFQPGSVDSPTVPPPTTGTKVIGGWVQKTDAAVWGRVVTADGNQSLDTASYFMPDEEWVHLTYRGTGEEFEVVIDGESDIGPLLDYDGPSLVDHNSIYIGRQGTETWGGRIDDFRVYDRALSDEEIAEIMAGDIGGDPKLQAGDADMDLDFDQHDLVKVQIAAKYLSVQGATWGEGDWDGGPGGSQGNPPAGDGSFNQLDIIAALSAGFYLTGPYGAVKPGGVADDGVTSVGYNVTTGEVFVDAPAGTDLTSINIDSASGIFTGDAAQNLGGGFDNTEEDNIFKATFGTSFGSITFGNVAQPGLSEEFVLNDLTVVGSLNSGGGLGDVDLIYVPEPTGALLLALGILGVLISRRRQ